MLGSRSGLESAFQLISKVFDGVESSSSPPNSQPFVYGPHCVPGGTVMLKQERAFP
uniref:Uncharacterized protein n=1 Tax=Anguilla anguilla TaxID=7936 RepID=A0A0E9XA27_ANGAN